MKKIIFVLFIVILVTGCDNSFITPTKRVEKFLTDYQNLKPEIIERLKNDIKKENLNKKQKSKFIELLEKQYQNMSFKIVNEEITDNKALVEVEIEVLNYNNSIVDSRKYYENNKDKIENYDDYMLNQIEKTTDKIKYHISFNLTKYNNDWELDEIDKNTIKKIHGLY